MNEPVAYLVSQEPLSSVRWLSDVKPIGVDDKQITPLYTAEQLHPRVKMTKAEFEIFSKAKVDEDSAEWLDNVAWDRVDYKYPDFFMAWLYPETVQIIDDDQS